MKLKHSNVCPICSGGMDELIPLPNLPMTEKFEKYVEAYTPKGFVDNAFLFCPECSHGKLETVIPPEELYAADYRTSTGKSVGASHSVNGFFSFLQRHVAFDGFDVVIDIGANDSSLLTKFPDKRRVAVDPNASGDAEIIKQYIEQADLNPLKGDRKLILSSHTLEHLEDPEVMLDKIDSILCYGDSVAMQFPSLDFLVKDARIDQIHHQHIHYFSLRSTSILFKKYGLDITQAEFDDKHYGTLRVLARRGAGDINGFPIKAFEILQADADFHSEMNGFNASVGRLRQPVAYGASLMLPVLRYYAPNLDRCAGIIDEDPSKDGLRYINFNKQIFANPQSAHDFSASSFVVTAFNTRMAVRKIATKLMEKGAAAVVVPFHCL